MVMHVRTMRQRAAPANRRPHSSCASGATQSWHAINVHRSVS